MHRKQFITNLDKDQSSRKFMKKLNLFKHDCFSGKNHNHVRKAIPNNWSLTDGGTPQLEQFFPVQCQK